MIKILRYRDQ